MTSDQNSEARQTFFGCVYRNAQSSPAEIGRLYAHQVHDQKQLTTEVVRLMESAFTVAMAESQDLRMQLEALQAEKYALEDQVRGLQELMANPVPQKYDDTLLPFVALMRKELHANAGKGDRPGWLSMSADTCLLEIIYHFGKLQKAVKNSDGDRMNEYAADVANMCMMLLDICGALAFVEQPEICPTCDDRGPCPVCMPEPEPVDVLCRGAWELGTACGRCKRCDETDPAKGWIQTLVTNSVKPGHHVYWFGRLDRKDDMAPTRIEAINGHDAWRELRRDLSTGKAGKARDV